MFLDYTNRENEEPVEAQLQPYAELPIIHETKSDTAKSILKRDQVNTENTVRFTDEGYGLDFIVHNMNFRFLINL